jgi:GTP-binding protein EngB required for normal cell division
MIILLTNFYMAGIFWNSKPKETSFTEQFLTNLVTDVSTSVNELYPNLKEEILDSVRLKNLGNINIKKAIGVVENEIRTRLEAKVSHMLKTSNVTVNMDKATDKLDEYIKMIPEKIDEQEDKQAAKEAREFIMKKNIAEKFSSISASTKTIKFALLGKTNSGKTSTVKYIFNIPIELKGGTKSDTSQITPYMYEQNGIKFITVDVPGFCDSEGRDGVNFKDLVQYFRDSQNSKEPIDLILWFSKINDIADWSVEEYIRKLNTEFGVKIWENTVIILTCANGSSIPDEYYSKVNEQLHKEGTEYDEDSKSYKILVWKEYVNAKKQMWISKFKPYTDKVMDIILVENSERENGRRKTGEGTLVDGTPIVETFYEVVLSKIGIQKSADALLFLAPPAPEPVSVPKSTPTAAPKSAPKSTPTAAPTATPKSTPKKKIVSLNEQQKAANKVANKTKESSSWCNLL